MRRALLALLLLAACSQSAGRAPMRPTPAPALEKAAIAAGVVRDPAATDIAGLYARDTDRVCIVAGRVGYRIGAIGRLRRRAGVQRGGNGGAVGRGAERRFRRRLRFRRAARRSTIAFPGRMPAACDKLCTDRASLTALEADLQSDAASEATTLRDVEGQIALRQLT